MSNKRYSQKPLNNPNLMQEYTGGNLLSRHLFRFGLRQSHVIEIREKNGNKFAKLPGSLIKEIRKVAAKHPMYQRDKAQTLSTIAQAYDEKTRAFVDKIMMEIYGEVNPNPNSNPDPIPSEETSIDTNSQEVNSSYDLQVDDSKGLVSGLLDSDSNIVKVIPDASIDNLAL